MYLGNPSPKKPGRPRKHPAQAVRCAGISNWVVIIIYRTSIEFRARPESISIHNEQFTQRTSYAHEEN